MKETDRGGHHEGHHPSALGPAITFRADRQVEPAPVVRPAHAVDLTVEALGDQAQGLGHLGLQLFTNGVTFMGASAGAVILTQLMPLLARTFSSRGAFLLLG